jgi:hypothetical protein
MDIRHRDKKVGHGGVFFVNFFVRRYQIDPPSATRTATSRRPLMGSERFLAVVARIPVPLVFMISETSHGITTGSRC